MHNRAVSQERAALAQPEWTITAAEPCAESAMGQVLILAPAALVSAAFPS
jgi:hypothetical protein